MISATLTSKEQITIPKAVRDALHLRQGDRVTFVLHGKGEALLKPMTKSVDEVYGRLHAAGQKSRSLEEMKAAVAKRPREQKL